MRKSTDELRKLRYINFCAFSFAAFSGFIADEFERRKFCGREKWRAGYVPAKKNNATRDDEMEAWTGKEPVGVDIL